MLNAFNEGTRDERMGGCESGVGDRCSEEGSNAVNEWRTIKFNHGDISGGRRRGRRRRFL